MPPQLTIQLLVLSSIISPLLGLLPDGFTSNILSPTIDTAGIYTAIATSGDNCISRVQIRVTEDFIVPKLTISPNQFKCKTDSLRINTTSIPSNVVFIWDV